MLVRFTKHCEIYMPGEVADFSEAKVQLLVKARAAVIVGPGSLGGNGQSAPIEEAIALPHETSTVQPEEVSSITDETAVVLGKRPRR